MWFVRRARHGVFSTKIQIKQYLHYLTNAVGEILFDGATMVVLTRKNLLAEAVSLHVAELTGVWSFNHAVLTKAKTKANFFDAEAIDRHLGEISAERQAWEGLFRQKSLQPMRITYEELCAEPPRILRDIADLCGVALQPPALAYDDQGAYQPYPWEPSKQAMMEYWLAERRASPSPAATELFAVAA